MKSRSVQPLAIDMVEVDAEARPLWTSIRQQLYRSEVSHVKRLVGEALIKDNRMMWDEVESLRQMREDFQTQNNELFAESPQAAQQLSVAARAPSLHRELLRRQANELLHDARAQAAICGRTVEELVPALSEQQLQDYVAGVARSRVTLFGKSWSASSATPSTRPSTRPSSAGGVSECSTPMGQLSLASRPVMPLGRALGVDDLAGVADGIREALEEEQTILSAAISKELELLDTEDTRRSLLSGRTSAASTHVLGEPSTEQLQQLVHSLQDFAMQSPSSIDCSAADPPLQSHLVGGCQVRRLKALIEQRRNKTTTTTQDKAMLPEAVGNICRDGTSLSPSGISVGLRKSFDPFFDDPFAA